MGSLQVGKGGCSSCSFPILVIVVIFHALFIGCKRGAGVFNAVCFFRQGAGSGAVFHLVVSARGFRRSYRMLKMQVVPCYPEYVRHTRELACTSSWLFQCFALFFIVLDEGADLIDVALSRLCTCLCLSFRVCRRSGCVPLVCPLVVFCDLASPGCVPLVSAVGGCWASGIVTVSAPAACHVCFAHSARLANSLS